MKKALLFFTVLAVVACNKNKEHCWQVYDALGNEMGIICGKTEAEIQADYGPFYDRSNAKKYCWKIHYNNGTIGYPENLTEKMAEFWFSANSTTMEKIPCGYCQKWMIREKEIYKPTGQFTFKPMRIEQYCGDTCSTIFAGRIIVLRETADSLIQHEFVQKY